MTYAVGAFSLHFERPLAVALAALLHALIAVALWAAWVQRPPLPPDEEAIQVSFELPRAPPPLLERATVSSPAQPLTAPLSKAPLALLPSPLQQAPLQFQMAPQVQSPAVRPPLPKPSEFAAPPMAAPAPIPPSTPAPTLQSLLAPLTTPPTPPARELDFRHAPPTPAAPPPPPAATDEEPSATPDATPADAFSRTRAADSYLWQVVRKLESYRFQASVAANRGVTVVRIVIARDGKLLEASIAKSSGVPEFDRGVLAGVRAGSPYAPLPADIKGASASFDLPLVSVAGR